MPKDTIKKLKVVFSPNDEPTDQIVTDALIVQLMVTVVRIGLRIDQLSNKDDIIRKEKEER